MTYPNIHPVAISIGPFQIHWYGIMYLLAFATAWFLAWRQIARQNSPIQLDQIEDLLIYGAMGVILGGRLGYVILYDFDHWILDPLWVFRVWEGGMAFHGGLLGVIFAIFLYCRRLNLSFFYTLDFIAPLVPLGLGFGRVGNFIGQELWGRITTVPWGIEFPHDPGVLRHPSQLYQAFLEGFILFVIVYWFSNKPRPQLAISSVFLIFYGIFRFAVEFFRQPDHHLSKLLFDWMTRGQLLTIPMIIIGICVLFWSYYLQNSENKS